MPPCQASARLPTHKRHSQCRARLPTLLVRHRVDSLAALFGGAAGNDTVSRVWRKVKADWEAWNGRSLAEEPIVRLILDGTMVRLRLDPKATLISLLVVIGVREDCWRSEHGWRDQRGLARRSRQSGQLRPTWFCLLCCIDHLSPAGNKRTCVRGPIDANDLKLA